MKEVHAECEKVEINFDIWIRNARKNNVSDERAALSAWRNWRFLAGKLEFVEKNLKRVSEELEALQKNSKDNGDCLRKRLRLETILDSNGERASLYIRGIDKNLVEVSRIIKEDYPSTSVDRLAYKLSELLDLPLHKYKKESKTIQTLIRIED